jgi:hypothetical protein
VREEAQFNSYEPRITLGPVVETFGCVKILSGIKISRSDILEDLSLGGCELFCNSCFNEQSVTVTVTVRTWTGWKLIQGQGPQGSRVDSKIDSIEL